MDYSVIIRNYSTIFGLTIRQITRCYCNHKTEIIAISIANQRLINSSATNQLLTPAN